MLWKDGVMGLLSTQYMVVLEDQLIHTLTCGIQNPQETDYYIDSIAVGDHFVTVMDANNCGQQTRLVQ